MSVPTDVRAHVAENGLTERSSWRATGHTAAVLALYAAVTTAGFLVGRWPVWVAVFVAQGCILVGSYSAMHEAAHGMLYRTPRANRVASLVWASTILVNSSLWRSFHLEHHAHTGDAEDPENRYKVDVTRRSQYLLFPLGGLQFLGQLLVESISSVAGRYPDYVRQNANRRAMRIDGLVLLSVIAGLTAATISHPGLVLHLWGGAFLLTACILLPGTAINEHYGCATEGSALETTRTVVSNRLVRFLVWNSNFHTGHHLVASVPFHKAPLLHEHIETRTTHLARSYTAFHLEVLRDCGRPRSTSELATDRG